MTALLFGGFAFFFFLAVFFDGLIPKSPATGGILIAAVSLSVILIIFLKQKTRQPRYEITALEERLHESTSMLNAILYSMDEGLLVIDTNYHIALMNRAASILLRIAPADMVGKDIRDAFPCFKGEAEKTRYHLPFEQVVEQGEIIQLKSVDESIYARDRNDKIFPIAIFLSSLIVGGDREGAVLVFHDISEEKRLNEARVSFISTASHQLHTPLTGVRWFSEMLLDGDAGPLTEQQKNFTDRIYEGITRMIKLVNLLLQIARLEAGRVAVEPRSIDLRRVIEDIIVSMRPHIEQKQLQVEFIASSGSYPPVAMDKDIIWQVVQNLVDNAIRYSLQKSTIQITLTFNDEKKEFTCSVRDRGIGIPVDQQPHIFQKFFRADNAIKYLPEGSGLGLNLVKQLVEGWSGAIGFESHENNGSVFHFTVPAVGMKPHKGKVNLTS